MLQVVLLGYVHLMIPLVAKSQEKFDKIVNMRLRLFEEVASQLDMSWLSVSGQFCASTRHETYTISIGQPRKKQEAIP